MTKKQLPLDELSAAIGRILGLLLTEEKVDQAVQNLSQAIKESVPGTLGAGVSILDTRGLRTSTGSTDSIVERADNLQYQLGQGPCLTAWASEETVLIDDVQTDDRWPNWSAAVRDLPIRSVVSAPLMANGHSIGAIKVYSPQPVAFDSATAGLMELFASPAATLLAHIQGAETPQRISAGLQTALRTRDMVNRACGVLMERHKISHERALQQLILTARTNNQSLHDISAELVAGIPADRIQARVMGFDSNEPEQRQKLKAALSDANTSVGALWLQYFSIGGSVGEYEVEAYLQGLLSLPQLERDLLAMAANELIVGTGPHAPYADEFPPSESPSRNEHNPRDDGQEPQ